ncbi:uncharacterized protein H6S33_009470 [Morchella sextelata]|uniref:uncharacterized protein n=1 Tax=Morchella sextelata TaxID=1174677 RepID=UPI001D04371F|nr:uncharacterized protein H6S33_009470 [Morchella sextelata]KAH0613090.1 hypothetical protein H6S33_009470 [Morchella sextelata]
MSGSTTTPRRPPNVPFFLVPPELFSIVTDAAPFPIYRCSSVSPENRPFLKTLNLKTILSLTAEKPSKPLRAISEEQNLNLVHLGLWQPRNLEASQPLSKSAVEKTLQLLTTDNLPALLVDGGHGIFVGVLRKLMGWNHTSIILDRSFAGNHPRYGNEEFIEMVDTSRINIPEGIEFLTWHGPKSNEEDKDGESEGEGEKNKGESKDVGVASRSLAELVKK